MDKKKRAKIFMEFLTKVYKTFSDIKEFIDNSLMDIFSRKTVSVDQIVFGLRFLWMVAFAFGIIV